MPGFMKKSKIVLGAFVLLFNFSAFAAAADENSRVGLWIQKDEAEELRTTGKVQSLCEEIKKDPGTLILNIRTIDADGAMYIHHPALPKIGPLKLGQLSEQGVLKVEPLYAPELGEAGVIVTAKQDVLTFSVTSDAGTLELEYLRATEDEARKYFEAQAACNM